MTILPQVPVTFIPDVFACACTAPTIPDFFGAIFLTKVCFGTIIENKNNQNLNYISSFTYF